MKRYKTLIASMALISLLDGCKTQKTEQELTAPQKMTVVDIMHQEYYSQRDVYLTNKGMGGGYELWVGWFGKNPPYMDPDKESVWAIDVNGDGYVDSVNINYGKLLPKSAETEGRLVFLASRNSSALRLSQLEQELLATQKSEAYDDDNKK